MNRPDPVQVAWLASGRPEPDRPRRTITMMRQLERLSWVRVRHVGGRTDDMARLCTVLSRSDGRGVDLLDALATDRRFSLADAQELTGATAGPLDPDMPLPWDFIVQHHGRDTLRAAYDVIDRRLSEGGA